VVVAELAHEDRFGEAGVPVLAARTPDDFVSEGGSPAGVEHGEALNAGGVIEDAQREAKADGGIRVVGLVSGSLP